jgi:tight adherence protein C
VTVLVILLLVFLSGTTAALALGRLVPEILRRRYGDLVAREWTEDGRRRSLAPFRAWRLAVAAVSRSITLRAGGAGWLRKLGRDLERGQGPGAETPEGFLARAFLEGLCLTVALLLFSFLAVGRPLVLLALAVGLLHAAVLRPNMVRARARRRLGAILRRLPYAMDLMILMVEAGATLDEALATVASGADRGDPLAEELERALAEAGAGATSRASLRRMAERLDLDELTSLVIALERADTTGAPIAELLETQSEVVQRRRMQRAERLAVEAPVKMMFPNMLILIAVLLIVLGPIFIQLVGRGVV